MVVHNSLMSRWLEHCRAWQYFVIAWAIGVSAAMAGALLFAAVYGRMQAGSFEFIPFGSLIVAAGATLGRQIWKRARPEP
jgi:hypothetical protein